MKWVHLAAAFCLVVVGTSAAFLTAGALRLFEAWEAIPVNIEAINRTVQGLPGQILPPVLAEVDKQAYQLSGATNAQVGRIVDLTDKRTGELLNLTRTSLANLDANVSQTAAHVSVLQASVSQTLGSVTALVNEDRPQLRGLLQDTRLAAAEFARSNIYVRQQLPAGLVTFQQIEAHVSDATQAAAKASLATQHTMEHLDTATKPLPAYFRIPLSITGAIAPTAAGAVSAAAATGAFK